MSGITPSQTVGPYFKYGLTPGSDYQWNDAFGNDLVTPEVSGERIRIVGRIFDGDGKEVPDSMLEIWQADSQGRYAHPRDPRAPNASFKGFGRSACDKTGEFGFDTIKPGAVPGPDGKPQAPHVVVCIFSRGMLRQLYTRMYFSDEPANATDPVLALVPEERRGTLIAAKEKDGVYRFDIRVQGEGETVFFEI